MLIKNFRVLVNGIYSSNFIIENGVPQGLVISPILFILLINHVTKVIQPFADDLNKVTQFLQKRSFNLL